MKSPLKNQHILVITQVNPYTPVGGVTVVLKNLFSSIDKNSYTFAYLGRSQMISDKTSDNRSNVYRLIHNYHPVHVFGLLFNGVKRAYAVRRAIRLAKKTKATCIIGLYPTLSSLEVSLEVAERTKLPFYPYLHDTVKEGLSHSEFGERAAQVQFKAFALATKIITMSEGMSNYYREEYKLNTYPLEHSYPEVLITEPNYNRNEKGFWGGEVYNINEKSFERVQKALFECNTVFTVTSLSKLKIKNMTNVQQTFFPSRNQYIEAVEKHGILVLAINWSDESDVHEAELSTIFPTKTIEYLASGSPILVHCPEHYFLAKFFRKHACGIVVSNRNPLELANSIKRIQDQGENIFQMQRNALKVIELFSKSTIQRKLNDILK